MATTGGGAGSDLSGSLLEPPPNFGPSKKTLFALIKTSSKKHQKNYWPKKTEKVNFTDRENLEYYLGKLETIKFRFGFGCFRTVKSFSVRIEPVSS